jgi:hypothetical protein
MNKLRQGDWYQSKDTRKKLKVDSCQLAHMRTEGKLEFKKLGNSFYYWIVQNVAKNR